MKDIVLVYRENDLFEQLVPAVVNVLYGFGCSVKTIEFDRSTTRQSVKENLVDRVSEFEDMPFIADETCLFPLQSIDADIDLILQYNNLDKVFDSVITHLIESGDGSSGFVKALKVISPESRPETVQVVTNHLTDHKPFSEMENCEVINQLREWFEEAGYKVNVEEAGSGIQRDWVIIYRHSVKYDTAHEFFDIVLGLPLANFIQDASRHGLLSLNESQLESRLSKELEEVITEG